MITTHGDDIYRYEDIVWNFSSNIYTPASLEPLKQYLAANLYRIANYPEPSPLKLERLIANRTGISPSCVVATNGVTEAIYLLAMLFRDQTARIENPTFGEYEAACRACGIKVCDGGRLVWLCNPNNPTGTTISKAQIVCMAHNNKTRFFVFDHAYEDYTLEPLLSDSEAVALGNVVVLHSLTKQYGIPGLRLGYVVAPPIVATELRRLKPSWSVNALAVAAGEWLLRNGQRPPTEDLLKEAQWLRDELNAINGVSVSPTMTNFMLATIKNATAAQLKAYLADKKRMLIRDASDFSGLTPHHFRIATQCREVNHLLVEAVKFFCKSVFHSETLFSYEKKCLF